MGTYTPQALNIQNGLDKVGMDLGLPRLDGETIANYRLRLDAQAKNPLVGTEESVVSSLSRVLGLLDTEVFSIDLILDGNDEPLAADPYIEITSSYIRLYDDYENESIDIEILLIDRNNGYFLRDVYLLINASTYFSITVEDPDYSFKQSKYLRIDSSRKHIERQKKKEGTHIDMTNREREKH